MPFKNLLSPAARAALEHRRSELARLYALPNQELAAELALLMDAARRERPDMTPKRQVYDSNFLWNVLPELIRRLGGPRPWADTGFRQLDDRAFRRLVGLYLRNMVAYDGGTAWALLTNEACNGNPVAFGVDRLCPGDLADTEDVLTRSIKEIARVRGTTYDGVWTPAVMVD